MARPARLILSTRLLLQALGRLGHFANDLAMQAGYSTATEKIREMGFGAGMGLCNIKNFSDFFRITSEIGKGTHLKMVIRIDKDFDGI